MPTLVSPIESSPSGADPLLICRVHSGLVYLSNMHYAAVVSFNRSPSLSPSKPSASPGASSSSVIGFWSGMQFSKSPAPIASMIGSAAAGPLLQAHIVPRCLNEPDELRRGLTGSHPDAFSETTHLDAERDKDLIRDLALAIKVRL